MHIQSGQDYSYPINIHSQNYYYPSPSTFYKFSNSAIQPPKTPVNHLQRSTSTPNISQITSPLGPIPTFRQIYLKI